MTIALTGAEKKRMRGEAQRLKPMVHIGKHGISDALLRSLDEALTHHGLVKVKFDEFKDKRKELAPQLAEKSRSELIALVGNVVVLYRPKPENDA